ncbi:hypothetical protein RRG08_014743 [Elysia crispata]|uniref:Uncharacterized protein n=1 Tax=Elysia crispata TaxID=231223 RepID=A0AAE1ASK1_9GAST|nr:hypothetical protein RRG08_014743 [Elysia crispata]
MTGCGEVWPSTSTRDPPVAVTDPQADQTTQKKDQSWETFVCIYFNKFTEIRTIKTAIKDKIIRRLRTGSGATNPRRAGRDGLCKTGCIIFSEKPRGILRPRCDKRLITSGGVFQGDTSGKREASCVRVCVCMGEGRRGWLTHEVAGMWDAGMTTEVLQGLINTKGCRTGDCSISPKRWTLKPEGFSMSERSTRSELAVMKCHRLQIAQQALVTLQSRKQTAIQDTAPGCCHSACYFLDGIDKCI